MWKFLTFCSFFVLGHGRYIDTPEPKIWVENEISETLPDSFFWGDVNGKNYLTKNLNQHLPQFCGSCWAHGALSSLADRIKIARNTTRPDINLPVQFLLNCRGGGTCNGGSQYHAYKYIHDVGGIPFDTCLQYEACSSDSHNEVCKNRDFSCKPVNICRTSTQKGNVAIKNYPNVTISRFYALRDHLNMMIEIYKNGPIACAINCVPIMDYRGGIVDMPNESKSTDHIVSIAGWGTDGDRKYWIIRNSWGEFWGELSFFRIYMGENQLGIEGDCAAAIPEHWTEHNKPCSLDGDNCL